MRFGKISVFGGLVLLAGVLAMRFTPIFQVSGAIEKEASRAQDEVRKTLIETSVDQISSALRNFCLKNSRAPSVDEMNQILAKCKDLSEVSMRNLVYSGPTECSADLHFSSQGREFNLKVPLPLRQRWSLPE